MHFARTGALVSAFLASILLASAPASVTAGERVKLGFGWLADNDEIGDSADRWQTGSVVSSHVWGRGWSGQAPERIGDLLELRIGAGVIAPRYVSGPAAKIDRPYASALSLGLHTHFRRGTYDLSAGADLVVTGPQTGLDGVQGGLHDFMGIPGPSAAVRAGQIGDGLHPTLVLEAGRDIALGGQGHLRPFAEARIGVETLARAGVDIAFGKINGQGELWLRDPVTGQRYRTIRDPNASGVGFVLGGDVAWVNNSVFLPGGAASPAPEDLRARLRAGLHWQGRRALRKGGAGGPSAFYGFTWLSPEYKGQSHGQVVGSVSVNLNF
ncbi:lipid A-modifier LpxR family protein [Aquicoccus sp. G2-2]|uniref:lipid A-modifier LpxR family protein n=1 Tax=Aquicoccus sp. G2-2 TaxID=3092120 RepID=UPI002ADF69F6|nr:lipid A-modifier LpxR family protein [Aquicoccus sp. G2-2]MEA1113657.1 DUF2219 family protein [Aquicoccus sp. G2-2]